MVEIPEVLPCDREAASDYLKSVAPAFPNLSDAIREKPSALSRAFARHRESALATQREAYEARIAAVRRVIAHGYPPPEGRATCKHDRGADDVCIACYDEVLLAALAGKDA